MSTFADVYRLWVRARNKAGSLALSRSFASWGAHSVVQFPVRISGERQIAIGSHVFIGSNSWLQVIGDVPGFHRPADIVAIRIGDGTRISGTCVLSAVRSIEIGNNVLIARNVYVADHSHAFSDPTVPVMEQGIDHVAPVIIDDGAWVGQNVVVNPGVRIGRNCVIGANSVVTKSVPDGALAVGAPARIARTSSGITGPV